MAALRRTRRAALVAVLVATATAAAGCGSATPETESADLAPAVAALRRDAADQARALRFRRLREAVVRGARRDFAIGTGVGGRRYESCVLALLREALDRATLTRLVAVYRRPDGQPFAAQALNQLAVPLGARCGHPYFVPELVEASRALRGSHLAAAGTERLKIDYGPYLGVRCRRPYHHGCDLVGIDVVLRHAATRVLALVGDRRLALRTPGMHDGVRYRDWVGTFRDAGFDRPGSPFRIPDRGRASGVWGGSPPVYVRVELRVDFATGRHARALLPDVFLSPGWG